LLNNIVLSDFSTTVGTTDANKICIKVEIIGTLEHLASAIRASFIVAVTISLLAV
jgi:hypothetical protein